MRAKKQLANIPTEIRGIQYNMQPEIQVQLDLIMKSCSINTTTKAINYCVMQHLRLVEALRKEESEANKIYREKMAIENEMSKLVQFLDYLQKHTKKG